MQAGVSVHIPASFESRIYTEQVIFHLDMASHLEAFVGSLRELLAVFPILRTNVVGEAVLVQAVWQQVPLPLTVMDLTALGQEEQEQQVRASQQADARRGFDIQQAPLLRLTVFRLGGQHHQLLWSFHHAILDGWSVSLLLQELF